MSTSRIPTDNPDRRSPDRPEDFTSSKRVDLDIGTPVKATNGANGTNGKNGANGSHAEDPAELIDTSKMSAGQRAALELTEAARDVSADGSFASRMFMGKLDLSGIAPFPEQSAEDRDQGDAFLLRLEKFLRERVDPDEIDRTGEIPADVIKELGAMGAFGIKISPAYGGLGL